jgi:hypothetical protein
LHQSLDNLVATDTSRDSKYDFAQGANQGGCACMTEEAGDCNEVGMRSNDRENSD